MKKAIISPDHSVQAIGDIEGVAGGVICGGCFFGLGFAIIDAGDAAPGDIWDGTSFHKSPPSQPPVPAAVSMRQARLALLGAGLLTQINTAIAAMPGTSGDAARIEWEFASEVRRDSPLVASLASALALAEEQLDALFVQASAL